MTAHFILSSTYSKKLKPTIQRQGTPDLKRMESSGKCCFQIRGQFQERECLGSMPAAPFINFVPLNESVDAYITLSWWKKLCETKLVNTCDPINVVIVVPQTCQCHHPLSKNSLSRLKLTLIPALPNFILLTTLHSLFSKILIVESLVSK